MTELIEKNELEHDHCCHELPGIPQGFIEEGHSPVDNLITGEFPQIMRLVKITGDELLPRGAVLGRIHNDDHCHGEDRYKFLSDHNCKDGSAMPDAILAQSVDTRCGDQEAYVYLAGEFNTAEVYLPKGSHMEEVAHILRKRSIFLRHH